MSDVVSNDDLNALAAEYVLGTLDYEERKGATALLEVDPDFLATVRIWERRFGELHLMVEAVEPDPQIWARIKPQLANVEQVAIAISSHEAERARAVQVSAAPPPAVPPVMTVAAAIDAPVTHAAAVIAQDSPLATERGPAVAEPGPVKIEASPAEVEPSWPVVGSGPAAVEPASPAIEPGPASLAESAPAAAEARATEAVALAAPAVDQTVADAGPPAIESQALVHAELKLAELAALLPVPGAPPPVPRTVEEVPEPAPEVPVQSPTPRVEQAEAEFVPPAPMVARGAPVVMGAPPVRAAGRGWVAATITLGLAMLVLGGLISAWRFFPDRLPAELRATSLLRLTAPAPEPRAKPVLAPFDE